MPRSPEPVEHKLITNQADLVSVCERAREEGRFAFDTEFVMEDRYEPEVCLIQLATESEVTLIDPFLKLDMSPIWKLICDPAVETIVHAGQEDLSLCVQHAGTIPRNVFDVQIAAGFVGFEYPISLQKLVQASLHVRLHKSKTLTDWRRRPLTAAQLRYAAEDVSHLPAARKKIGEKLKKLGREAWAKEEFERFENKSCYSREEEDKLRRVKGASALKGKQVTTARELLAWRDELARKLDRPARVILKDHLLVEIARLQLSAFSEIRDLRGLNMSDKHVQALGKVVEHSTTLPPESKPIRHDAEIETPRETVLIALATAVLRGYCLERDLAYGLVATKKSIRDLIRNRVTGRNGDVDLLRGWRADTVGLLLEGVLSGKRTVQVDSADGEPILRVT